MKRLIMFSLVLSMFSAVFSAAPMFNYILPWDDASPSMNDLSSIIYRDIDSEGFVTTTPGGHFAVNSGRIKFWGTNTTFGANFPSAANAPKVAGRLAKYGFNLIRFHHMDMADIWTTTNPDRIVNPAKLDRMDYLIYSLKQKGIYSDINLLVSRPFTRGTNLPADIDLITDWKVRGALGFFDPQTRQMQKDYAYDVLTHVNPYTGNAYIDEPAIAFIEINNENGLTQAYMSQQLDPLPPYYSNLLKGQWNTWLKAKYATHAALETAWGASNSPLGAELLINGNFGTGLITPWNKENANGSVAAAAIETGTAPGGINACRIDVTTAGTETWVVQFNQANLSVTTGVPYTVTFYAKADTNRTIAVGLMMAHAPWANLGFNANINLTTAWQSFSFTFTPNATDANARINFGNMGMPAGASYWFAGVSLKQGGLFGLAAGEDLYATSIDNFKRSGGPGRTIEGQKDWYRFLQETEEAYWGEMRNYVETSLGAKSIVFGTIIGCSTPNVQNVFDAIDTHSYWQHPAFPGTPWDSIDWYVGNNAMVNSQANSTVGGLGVKAVLNKPLLVTEYNHPHPTNYESEGMLFLSTYASLQDWDAVLPFDYNSSDIWNSGKIDGFFTLNQNPIKMSAMIPAALAFYRSDISPANQTVVVPIDRAREIDELVTGNAWQLVDAEKAGESQKSTYIHKVRIAVEGQSVPGGSLAPGTTNVTGSIMTSDTNQITWNSTNPTAGFVRVDSPMSKFLYGFTGGATHYLSGVTITPGASLASFSSIAVTAMDGVSFASAQKILVTALGTAQNTGEIFYQYPNTPVTFPPALGINVTVRNQWGNSPSTVEGIASVITLPCAFADTQVWALDDKGARKTSVPVVNAGGFAQFSTSYTYGSLWYEVSVSHPEYSPTMTATNTPVYSPTITPTITATATAATADIVDDFEVSGTQNYWLGYSYTYKDVTSTIGGAEEFPGGPVTAGYAYHAVGNLGTGGYAGIGMNLSSGPEKDLSAYAGLQFYIKGNGTPLHAAIVTGNFTDVTAFNHWEFTVPTTATWTFVQIPFSSMTQPYGTYLPFDLTRAEDIQFKINTTGAFDIYLDDVAFYYPAATPTRTPTITPTAQSTATDTATVTQTITTTDSPTATETITGTPPTATQTPTITETQTDSPTFTETQTGTHTATATETFTETPTYTATPTGTDTQTVTLTPTVSNTMSATVTFTATRTRTATYTPTFTGTSTLTRTVTFTPTRTTTYTQTPVLSFTNTPTLTPTNTITPEQTFTNTPAATATTTQTQAVLPPSVPPSTIGEPEAYSNPYNPSGAVDLSVRFELGSDCTAVTVDIYTTAYRLVRRQTVGTLSAGLRVVSIPKTNLSSLSTGHYIYVVSAMDDSGKKIKSKIKSLIIIK